MDIFAHGLWTALVFNNFNKSKKIWLPIFFGVAPDIFSFGIYLFAYFIFTGSFPFNNSSSLDASRVPKYTDVLYNFTHSLVIFSLVFLIVWILRKKPFRPLAAWGMHILIDIPLHNAKFFPTPFLFPLSSFKVSLISWADPYVMILNYLVLAILYLFIFLRRRKSQRSQTNVNQRYV